MIECTKRPVHTDIRSTLVRSPRFTEIRSVLAFPTVQNYTAGPSNPREEPVRFPVRPSCVRLAIRRARATLAEANPARVG